jgi:hypothetical protein
MPTGYTRTVVQQLSTLVKETNGNLFIPYWNCQFFGGTWTPARVAAGDYRTRRTAGAGTTRVVCSVSQILWQRLTDVLTQTSGGFPSSPRDINGVEVKSVSIAYGVGTAALTSATVTVYNATYANSIAAVVGASTSSIPLANLGPDADPLTESLDFEDTVITTSLLNTPRSFTLELEAVCDGSAVLDIYGFTVFFNYNIL